MFKNGDLVKVNGKLAYFLCSISRSSQVMVRWIDRSEAGTSIVFDNEVEKASKTMDALQIDNQLRHARGELIGE